MIKNNLLRLKRDTILLPVFIFLSRAVSRRANKRESAITTDNRAVNSVALK